MNNDSLTLKAKNMDVGLSRISQMTDEEIAEVLHDLSVHQSELEMQNDQLRLTQEELKVSQQRAYQIFYNAPVGYVALNNEGIIKQCNLKFAEFVDMQDRNVIGHPFVEFITESDRASYNVWKRTSIANKPEAFKFICAGENDRFLSISISKLMLTVDEAVLLVTCSDVTELKKSEEALKVSSIVFENANEAAMVVDSNFKIISVNPAFTKITGYSEKESIGSNPNILNSGKHDNDYYRELYSALNKKGSWEGEIWNRRKNGQVYPEWLSINVMSDVYGNPYRYVCVFKDNSQHETDKNIIKKQATHDALTGLPNRILYNDRLEQAILHAVRSQNEMAVIFLDLDGFKDINDTLGHYSGDLLLKEVSLRLKSSIRETDTVARLGGDEFAIILLDIHSHEDIKRTLENILHIVQQPFTLSNEVAYVTASIGAAIYPRDADNSEDLLKSADQAMYSAKDIGKNCFKFFTEQMETSVRARLQISNDLRSGNLTDFCLYYQPIVCLKSGDIVKAEALLRWNHPMNKTIGPDVFIPIAEENGYILKLGEFAYEQAVKDLAYWKETYNANFQVSVNKSPKQFKYNLNCANRWIQKLTDLSLSGENIIIEITEGLLLEHNDSLDKELLALRDAGLEVALDDFGTGYSSLAYLRKYDIDYIKIDKSFISQLETDPDSLILCEAIILMAHKLGMKVIAEGIETDYQRKKITSIGCDYGQGFLISHPLPKHEFEKLLVINPTYDN